MSRQKILLLTAITLLVMQLGIVPIFRVLDEKRDIAQIEDNKYAKERALLLLKEPLEKEIERVNEYLKTSSDISYPADSTQTGMIAVQNILENAAKKNNVKVKRLSWKEADESGSDVKNHKIELFIDGDPTDWVALQSEIESKRWLTLTKMSFFHRINSDSNQLLGEVSGVLAYNVNFWVETDGEN